ncbi:hypothetical protein MRB53_003152 [Persea americana]|uniref:Uncharacterized protein n=1 Tax=Persea americana TaxID=3435 RepID=A0ACC2MY74_PERAE|nr:hypothetical protein MRB53_003152 [Persea americana]
MLIACLYVDDLLFTGNSPQMFEEFKHAMFKEFEMTDCGLMSFFLAGVAESYGCGCCFNNLSGPELNPFG